MNTLPLALLTLGITACVGPDERFGHVEQEANNKCESYLCGNGNSPVVDNMGFHDLNVNGLANSTGFTLQALMKGNVEYKPKIYASELTGYQVGGTGVLIGSELINSRLIVTRGSDTYEIQIAGVSTSDYWATLNGAVKSATSYWLQWKVPDDRIWQNVCVSPPAAGHGDLRGSQPAANSFLFEGDRIDAETKVFTSLDDDWFNIGCMGHALAKLHLTGHTEAAKRQRNLPSTTAQRETFMRMIIGDYCRSGQPFTVAGQPLDYMNSSKTNNYVSTGSLAIEARWDRGGATCLTKARVAFNGSPAADAAFPDGVYRAMLESRCSIPPDCADTSDILNLDGHYLMSANPY